MCRRSSWTPPRAATTGAGRAEPVLLGSERRAGASGGNRVRLEADRIQEAAAKDYAPPSLGELLGLSGGEVLDESELLDPVAESQRLQREGYVTPVDPNAAAEVEDEAPAQAELYRLPGRLNKKSPITVEGTGPAY